MSSKATRSRKKKIMRKEVEDLKEENERLKNDLMQARQGVFRIECKMAATLRALIDKGIISENDWEKNYKGLSLKKLNFKNSKIKADSIDYLYLLSWREHCVECAPPECYQVCPLYVERADRKCARFRYSIV